MEKQKGLFKKLLAIRKSMPKFERDANGHNYTYVSGEQVLEAFRKEADNQEVLLMTEISDKMDISTNKLVNKNGGERIEYCVNAKMNMKWVDAESGETLSVPFAGAGSQDDPSQAEGSMLTYVERYFLMKFFNVPTEDMNPDKVKSERKAIEETQTPPVGGEMTIKVTSIKDNAYFRMYTLEKNPNGIEVISVSLKNAPADIKAGDTITLLGCAKNAKGYWNAEKVFKEA